MYSASFLICWVGGIGWQALTIYRYRQRKQTNDASQYEMNIYKRAGGKANRERERERTSERDRGRETERSQERERERARERERGREIARKREREKEIDK